MTRVFECHMMDGRVTTDVEEALEWIAEVSIVTPEFARQMRADWEAAQREHQGQPPSKGSWK